MEKILQASIDRERRLKRLAVDFTAWQKRLRQVYALDGEETCVDCRVEFDQPPPELDDDPNASDPDLSDPDAHVVAHVVLDTLVHGDREHDPLAALATRMRKWADELCPPPGGEEFHGVTELYHAICAAFPEFGTDGLMPSHVSLTQTAEGYTWRAAFYHDDFNSPCGAERWLRHYVEKTANRLYETVITQGRADLAEARKKKLIAARVGAAMDAELAAAESEVAA